MSASDWAQVLFERLQTNRDGSTSPCPCPCTAKISEQVDGSHVERMVGGGEMGLVVVTGVRGTHRWMELAADPDDVQALGNEPSVRAQRKKGAEQRGKNCVAAGQSDPVWPWHSGTRWRPPTGHRSWDELFHTFMWHMAILRLNSGFSASMDPSPDFHIFCLAFLLFLHSDRLQDR